MILTFVKVFPFVCLQMFVKEGTLMKVLKKSRLPRHLFLVLSPPLLSSNSAKNSFFDHPMLSADLTKMLSQKRKS